MRNGHLISNRNSKWTLLLFVAAALASGILSARKLTEYSPFMPPSYGKESSQPRKVETQQVQIERFTLCGILKIDDEYHFSIYDKKASISKWIKGGVNMKGLKITSYDPVQQIIEIEWNGSKTSIKLVSADEQPIEIHFVRNDEMGTGAKSPASAHSAHSNRHSGKTIANNSIGRRYSDNIPSSPAVGITQDLIYFTNGTSRVDRTVNADTPGGFASNERFADPDIIPSPDLEQPPESTDKSVSLSIFPRTRVDNPSGKTPDHILRSGGS